MLICKICKKRSYLLITKDKRDKFLRVKWSEESRSRQADRILLSESGVTVFYEEVMQLFVKDPFELLDVVDIDVAGKHWYLSSAEGTTQQDQGAYRLKKISHSDSYVFQGDHLELSGGLILSSGEDSVMLSKLSSLW